MADAVIYQLGGHERMTPEEALSLALREAGDFEDVLIVAVERDTKNLVIRSSAMTRAGAAFLAKKVELHAHGVLGDDDG